MVKSKITSRFSSINSYVILAQTDTTVGFASQSYKRLADIKSRPNSKPFIIIYPNFHNFLTHKNRVPSKQKNLVRRAKKTTFILKKKAFRINSHAIHSQLIRNLGSFYSTSANQKNKNFNREFCESKTDIIIEDKNGLVQNSSSTLVKINSNKKVRIR